MFLNMFLSSYCGEFSGLPLVFPILEFFSPIYHVSPQQRKEWSNNFLILTPHGLSALQLYNFH